MSVRKELYNNEIASVIKDFGQMTTKSCENFDEVSRGWQDTRQRDFYNRYINRLRDEMISFKSDLEMIGLQLQTLQSTLNNLNN
jgi:hypothetical protein